MSSSDPEQPASPSRGKRPMKLPTWFQQGRSASLSSVFTSSSASSAASSAGVAAAGARRVPPPLRRQTTLLEQFPVRTSNSILMPQSPNPVPVRGADQKPLSPTGSSVSLGSLDLRLLEQDGEGRLEILQQYIAAAQNHHQNQQHPSPRSGPPGTPTGKKPVKSRRLQRMTSLYARFLQSPHFIPWLNSLRKESFLKVSALLQDSRFRLLLS